MPQQKFLALFVSESSDGQTRQESFQLSASNNGGPPKPEAVVIGGASVTLRELRERLACEGGVVEVPVEISDCEIVRGDDAGGADTLDLSHVAFRRGLSFKRCRFRCQVNFSFAVFEHSADFTATRFCEGADFRAARAEYDFRLTLARFDKYACFDDLRVGETFRAEGTSFAAADFNRASFAKNALFCSALLEAVGGGTRLARTHFRGRADFTDAHVGGSAYFKGACFTRRAIFDRLRVDGAAFFDCDFYQEEEYERADNLQFKRRKIEPPGGRLKANKFPLCPALFAGKVSFVAARFGSSVSFSGTRFGRDADFRRVHIEGTAIFDHFRAVVAGRAFLIPARFGGDALFQMLNVGGEAQFNAVQFRGKANFERAQIGGRVHFSAVPFGGKLLTARFGGEARFREAHFKGTAIFLGALFEGKANFQHFSTDVSVLFRSAEYRQEDDFSLRPNPAVPPRSARPPLTPPAGQMRPPDEKRGTLAPVVFKGEAHFLAMRARGTAEFDGAQFETDASFERVAVGGSLRFRPEYYDTDPVLFKGVANFIAAVVEGSAHFSGTQFDLKADFRAALFKGNAYFDDILHVPPKSPMPRDATVEREPGGAAGDATATPRQQSPPQGGGQRRRINTGSVRFTEPVLFSGAHFLNDGDFAGTWFKQGADFTNVVIGGTAVFREAIFGGLTNFRGATLKVLSFGLPEDAAQPRQAAGVEAAAGGAGAAAAAGQGANQPESQEDATPRTGPAVFADDASLDLRGLTYEQVELDLDAFLEKLEHNSRFERQPYTQLEKVFTAVGDDRRAGDIYFNLRWRELREKRAEVGREGLKLLGDLRDGTASKDFSKYRKRVWLELVKLSGLVFDLVFLGGLARFGVRPFRLLVISLCFLGLGAVFFSRPGAVTPKADPPSSGQAARPNQPASACEGAGGCAWSEALAVSLNQFIPIVEIPSGSRWKPSETPIPVPLLDGRCEYGVVCAPAPGWCKFDYFSYAFYGTIHRLFGAILVPLGLAALTGLLHRREKASGKT